jgi:hypothetical protein
MWPMIVDRATLPEFMRNIPDAFLTGCMPTDEAAHTHAEENKRRSCGSCTLCCKTYAILELKKPAGCWCPNAVKGGGCSIYVSRPRECAKFYCTWILGWFDENDRPDKIGVVFDAVSKESLRDLCEYSPVLDAYLKSGAPPAMAVQQRFDGAAWRPRPHELIGKLRGHGIAVVVFPASQAAERTILFPGGHEERYVGVVTDVEKNSGYWKRVTS